MNKHGRDYSNLLLGVIAVAFTILIVLLWQSRRQQSERVRRLQQQAAQLKRPRPTPQAPMKQNQGPVAGLAERPSGGAKPQANPTNLFQAQLMADSARTLGQFSDAAHIKFNLLMPMQFTPLDLDDGMAGIHGHDSASKTGLTALAYGKDTTPEQALEFLKSEASFLPGLSEGLKSIGPAQDLPPPNAQSGLKSATMWTGELANGNEVNVVMLRRQDARGSYMFVYSGPKGFFRGNDGAFEGLYDSLQALPAR